MKRSRNLLAYFFESDLWLKYEARVTNSYAYWMIKDPERAERMWQGRLKEMKGITVAEYIYDIFECIDKSKLKPNTKLQLIIELEQLEKEHREKKTLEAVI